MTNASTAPSGAGQIAWLGTARPRSLAGFALAHRRAALRLGNVGNAAGLLASLDILNLEVAAIGDDVDAQDFAGRLRGLRQRPMSTTWLVIGCSTISVFFASTAT
jgi:hypothetical protein